MKVCFVGPFLDNTGVSHALIDYILALDSVSVDVACRPIKLNSYNGPIPKRIEELMRKPIGGSTISIQTGLPPMFDFDGRFDKNVGLYFTETSNFRASSWPDYLNCMDELIVCSNQSKQASIDSGVEKPIHVVPIPADINKYSKRYGTIPLPGGKFVFYSIGEMSARKNFNALIRAYHTEFNDDDDVQLVLKTNGVSAEVSQYIQQVKAGLRLYADSNSYKSEIVITDHLSEEQMVQLHHSCDCFVSTSFGEAWSIPNFDAMGFGRTPICPKSTGFLDYCDDSVGYMVDVNEEPVYGCPNSANLFNSKENWFAPSVNSIRKQMRLAFEDSKLREEKARAGYLRALEFSHEKVGLKLKEILEK